MGTRAVAKLYAVLCRAFPAFRKSSRRLMYRLMANYFRTSNWSFMNYGYAPLAGQADVPSLHDSDERNRFCIQLYHHVVHAVDLTDSEVLEIGCGRGGGAAYIRRYHLPRRIVGIDFSEEAVSFCNKNHRQDGLLFIPGDAERLPFRENCFDAVINVESSHCYGSMDAFLSQVKRVLRLGGTFLYADFRHKDQVRELDEQLLCSGMRVIQKNDITANVLCALDLGYEQQMAMIRGLVPSFLVKPAQEFAGLAGSNIYDRFRAGIAVYQSFLLVKQ